MDVLFLQNIWFEFLGTMSLLGVAKHAGYHAGLAIGNDRELLKAVVRYRPKFVAFSCVTGIQGWALNLCARIKKIDPSIITIMGGPHPTFFPEIIHDYPHLDIICIGEGEGAILDLLKTNGDLRACKQIENLTVKINDAFFANPPRPLISNLETLPFLERELFYQGCFLID